MVKKTISFEEDHQRGGIRGSSCSAAPYGRYQSSAFDQVEPASRIWKCERSDDTPPDQLTSIVGNASS